MIGDTANSTPALIGVAGTAYTYMGLPMSVWVSLFTILYLVVQTIAAAPKAAATIKRVYRRLKGESHVESID